MIYASRMLNQTLTSFFTTLSFEKCGKKTEFYPLMQQRTFSSTHDFWNTIISKVQEKKLPLIANTIWNIWTGRNAAHFEHKRFNLEEVVMQAMNIQKALEGIIPEAPTVQSLHGTQQTR